MFGKSKKSPAQVEDNGPVVDKEQLKKDIYARLLERAKEQYPETIAKFAELEQHYREETQRLRDEFQFNCRRYGDFLTFEIEYPKTTDRPHDRPRKEVRSINLRNVSQIIFYPGEDVGLNADVPFVIIDSVEPSQFLSSYTSSSSGFLNVFEPVVGVEYDTIPYLGKETHDLQYSDQAQIKYRARSWFPFYEVPGASIEKAPSHSKPENINFIGSDFTLAVPYGRGMEIYHAILEEISRGFDQEQIIITTNKQ